MTTMAPKGHSDLKNLMRTSDPILRALVGLVCVFSGWVLIQVQRHSEALVKIAEKQESMSVTLKDVKESAKLNEFNLRNDMRDIRGLIERKKQP